MITSKSSLRAGLFCSAAAVVCAASDARAQTADSSRAIELDPIVVKASDPVGDAADRATAVYVAEAELDRARMGDLKDLFAGLANVSVGGAIPVAQKIFVNGIDMLNLTIAVDGALQNNRAFHHVSANAFDPGLLKFVRVDPGVAAADTGPNAVAGAVIMETVDAGDILDPDQAMGGSFRLGYGSNGATRSGALTLAGRSQSGFEALAYVKRVTGDDYKDGAGDVVLGTGADMTNTLLKFAYESEQGHRVELSGQRLVDDAARPYRANIAELPSFTGPKTRIYDTTRSNFSLRYENTNDFGLWDPELSLGFSESDIGVPSPYQSRGISSTLSFKAQNTFHLSDYSTITAGLDFYRKEAEYSDPLDGTLAESTRNSGLFAQLRMEPNEKWRISGGLRYDWQQFDGIGGYAQSVNGASGNLSATYHISDRLSVRAGYSNVFGGIQLEDNYEFWRRWSYDGLRGARAQNYIAGIDWKDDRLTLGAEVFLTEIDRVRSGGSNVDFQSKGYSLAATYGWDLGFLRFSYTDTEVALNGDAAGSYDAQDLGAPLGQVIALEVQHELPAKNLLIGGSLDMALDYDDTRSTSDQGLEGYQVVNLFAEYSPPAFDGVKLRASVFNLFDTEYADRATYGADYASVVALNEPGRALMLELIARF